MEHLDNQEEYAGIDTINHLPFSIVIILVIYQVEREPTDRLLGNAIILQLVIVIIHHHKTV